MKAALRGINQVRSLLSFSGARLDTNERQKAIQHGVAAKQTLIECVIS
jgi:hypothetical protein